MKNYETATPMPQRSMSAAGPGQLLARLCDKCKQRKQEGPGWRFVNKTWWHCPTCTKKSNKLAPLPDTADTEKTAIAAAIEAVAVVEKARVESKRPIPQLGPKPNYKPPQDDAHVTEYQATIRCEAHVLERRSWLEHWLAENTEPASGPMTKHHGRCLLWTGDTTRHGVPIANRGGRIQVRRMVFRELYGISPDGLDVAPICGNGLCMRHLKGMTRSERIKLTYKQGHLGTLSHRSSITAKVRAKSARDGKCTMELAREVRQMAASRPGITANEIAKVMNMRPGAVRDILTERRWKENKQPPIPHSSIFRLAGAAA